MATQIIPGWHNGALGASPHFNLLARGGGGILLGPNGKIALKNGKLAIKGPGGVDCCCPGLCCGENLFQCEFGIGQICYTFRDNGTLCETTSPGASTPNCGELANLLCGRFGQDNEISLCDDNPPDTCEWTITAILYCPVGGRVPCDWRLCVDYSSGCFDDCNDFTKTFAPTHINLVTGEFWFENLNSVLPCCDSGGGNDILLNIRMKICTGSAPTTAPSGPNIITC